MNETVLHHLKSSNFPNSLGSLESGPGSGQCKCGDTPHDGQEKVWRRASRSLFYQSLKPHKKTLSSPVCTIDVHVKMRLFFWSDRDCFKVARMYIEYESVPRVFRHRLRSVITLSARHLHPEGSVARGREKINS
jgi:hypothetical protein